MRSGAVKAAWKTCAGAGITGFVLYPCITYWASAVSLLAALPNADMLLFLGCALEAVTVGEIPWEFRGCSCAFHWLQSSTGFCGKM